MPAEYDVFLSHAWADGDRPQQIADALTKAGLRVWFDANEINDFEGITKRVTEGLAKSKALLAYYSKTFPLRRACQWELTAAFLAAQREGDPRRRVLVINPEKGADHIHPIQLRDEKFLKAPDNNGQMQEAVQSIVKHVAALDGPLPDPQPLTAPNWYGMTPVGSTRFVGRLAEMWELHSLLSVADVAQITGAVVNIGQVSGLGGVGKSLLAEEYGLHFGAAYPGGVFWLRAYGNDESKATLGPQERETLRADQVRAMAERLGINTQGMTAPQIEGALERTIGDRGGACLWVVDDVPNGLDGGALRAWFAPHPLARTLITTRSREYGSLSQRIDLSVLAPEEAYQLLTSRTPPVGEAEEEQARALASDLGYHALALDVTASAVFSYGGTTPFSSYRTQLARTDKDALELAKDLADALPNGHEASIAQTMLRSIRNLGEEGQDFLRLASVLAVAPIPAPLVSAVFEETDSLSHEDAEWRQAQAFDQVNKASLAEVAGEKQDERSVHTLVSRVVRFQEKSTPDRTTALRAAAVLALMPEIRKAPADPVLYKPIELHVAHARQMVAVPRSVPEATLVYWVAVHDHIRGAYASARALGERALEFRRREQGPEHPDTLRSMSNLATTLLNQGDLEGARKLAEEVLAVRLRVDGREHLDTLVAAVNLAEILRAHGALVMARQLQEEVLAVGRRVLGPEHPDIPTWVSNLALTLSQQGDLEAARKLQEQVLGVQLQMKGSEHPHTLDARNNLAATLYAHGDLVGAREQFEGVLGAYRRVLGPEHPKTLISMINLAQTLHAQGDLAGAQRLQEEVLDITRRVLGPEHPDTLISMSNLAQTLHAQGDLAGARKLQEEALAISRRVFGVGHPTTSVSAWNLVHILSALGAHDAAATILRLDLRWLLDRDPATLDAQQRQIREYFAQFLGKSR